MGNKWRSRWELAVRHTSVAALLNALTEAGLVFYGAHPLDEVTLYMEVPYSEIRRARELIIAQGGELVVCRPYGLQPTLLRLWKRTALITAAAVCIVLLGLSNLFVWRIDVVGNDTVPRGAVVRAMTACGAGIGRFWPMFDGEQLRTDLLLCLEDVQWVTVNYKSGAVEVVLREKRKVPMVIDNDEPVHIAAEKAGVVTALAVKQGQSAVRIGDTVEQGQLLISGAAASPIGTTRTVHALGSVEARTWYVLSARLPAVETVKRQTGRRALKISVILGEKRLNFYRNSSIFGSTCDTITMDYHLCMEGVFALPVRILVQQCVYWTAQERQTDPEVQLTAARDTLMETLRRELGDEGTVVTADFASQADETCMTVTVMAECLEEIGEEVPISSEELRQIQMDNTTEDEAADD